MSTNHRDPNGGGCLPLVLGVAALLALLTLARKAIR